MVERFVLAQEGIHDTALAEVRAGRKLSHWMWFVYPQLAGLGRSEMAERFGIADLDEARRYLAHPLLGPRLREMARVAAEVPAGEIEACFGTLDALKLRSSMTLFELAERSEPVFATVLDRHFAGQRDPLTLTLLGSR